MDAIDVNLDPNAQNGLPADPATIQQDYRDHAFKEFKICQRASDGYRSNYNAWTHRIWILKNCFNCSIQVDYCIN